LVVDPHVRSNNRDFNITFGKLISRFGMRSILLLTISCFILYVRGPAQDTWTEKASFPHSRWAAIAFGIGDYGYAGTGAGEKVENDFWRYDPKNDTWQEIDSMPTLGRYGAFSFVIDGYGYVGAGVNEEWTADWEFWQYDPVYDRWGRKENMPRVVFTQESLVSFSIEDHGYLYAPYSTNNFFEYDPETDTWTPKSNYPGDGRDSQVGFTIGNKGYIGAGLAAHSLSKEFWEYDPVTDSWTQKADFSGIPRSGAVGFSIGNCGYIGLGMARGVFYNDFWEYHQPSNTWRQVADCSYYSDDGFAMTIGTKGYVGTGISYNGCEIWEYTPDLSGVQLTEQQQHFSIFPNPVSDHLSINTDIPTFYLITIFNSQGQKVMINDTNNRTINVSGLSTGIYQIVCQTTDSILNAVFIKE
jgi:N-acetylneuraminic acid mutarotase